MSARKSNNKASEMFSEVNGKRVDAHIHEPILDNPEANNHVLSEYRNRLKADGFSDESIARLAGDGEPEVPPGTMNRGGKPRKMAGGGANPWSFGNAKHPRHGAGMIKSSIPGRTDKIPMSVPPGSYILPADIPSALGQGNTMAGEKILGNMFKIGPYGSGMTGAIKGGHPARIQANWMRMPRMAGKIHMAGGGEANGPGDIPIIAAGGEYVIHPEQVAEIGHGDMDAGHRVLDKFVLSVRNQHIKTLKGLKSPKKG